MFILHAVFPLPDKVHIANSTINAWTETGK